MQMNFVANNLIEVELGQESFFDLKKGEKINYRIIPTPVSTEAQPIDKINIFTSDTKLFNTDHSSCDSKGCLFTVEALEDGKGNIYIGESLAKNPK